MIISRTKKPELEPDNAASNIFKKMCACGLTSKLSYSHRQPRCDCNDGAVTSKAKVN